jgi:hypothetical protein
MYIKSDILPGTGLSLSELAEKYINSLEKKE